MCEGRARRGGEPEVFSARFRSRDAARPLIERLVAGDHIVRVSPEELTAETQQVRRCRFRVARSFVRLLLFACLFDFVCSSSFGSFSVFWVVRLGRPRASVSMVGIAVGRPPARTHARRCRAHVVRCVLNAECIAPAGVACGTIPGCASVAMFGRCGAGPPGPTCGHAGPAGVDARARAQPCDGHAADA